MYSKKQRYYFLITLSFIILFFLYLPSFEAIPFWDDLAFIFGENGAVAKINNPFLYWSDSSGVTKAWPLSYSILWILFKIFGHKYFMYQYVALLVHGVNAIIVERLFRREDIPYPIFGALIFLFHPLHVETLSWTIQLNTTLAFTFYFISLHQLLDFTKYKTKKPLIISFLFFFFSIATKNIATPLIIIFVFILRKRGSFNKALVALLVLPYVLSSIYFSIKTLHGIETSYIEKQHSIGHDSATVNVENNSSENIIKNIADKISQKYILLAMNFQFYIEKFLLPINQVFVYPKWKFISVTGLVDIFLFSLVFLVFSFRKIGSYTFSHNVKKSFWFFFFSFLPFSGIVYIPFMKYSYVAGHWAYFMVVGLTGLMLSLIQLLEKMIKSNRIITISLSLFISFLAFQTFKYVNIVSDPEELLEKTIQQNPREIFLYTYLSKIYISYEDYQMARESLYRGLFVDPDNAEIILSLIKLKGKR